MVSVIIPVYNVEKFLVCCIESVLIQSYEDFEILLIDDGSTDSSGELCDKMILKDKRIKSLMVEFHLLVIMAWIKLWESI